MQLSKKTLKKIIIYINIYICIYNEIIPSFFFYLPAQNMTLSFVRIVRFLTITTVTVTGTMLSMSTFFAIKELTIGEIVYT
jgi:hypothetical protein